MKYWTDVQTTIAKELSDFLSEILPSVGGVNWWRNYVIGSLTPAQARSAESISEGDLRSFDLAALLRIADKNWSEISVKTRLPRETRNLIIEMKSVRNQYAHANAHGIDIWDQIRNLDTAVRLLKDINANESSISDFIKIHRALLFQAASSETGEPTPVDQDTIDPGHHEPPSETGWVNSTIEITNDQDHENTPEANEATGRFNWLISASPPGSENQQTLSDTTYLGIDFGTSTTVVSMVFRKNRDHLSSKPLPIEQPEEFGGSILHHLVNTVLAWRNGKLYFGQDAYRLRQELFAGRTVFSSFKMQLGILGPTYPETSLPRGVGDYRIEDARDATREFFKMLYSSIQKSMVREGLPDDLRFAVSVPASFEANQRRDLLICMNEAGLPIEYVTFIDEPNAAFLSFIHESFRTGTEQELINRLITKGTTILVYDFGAGTCDVSIIFLTAQSGQLKSQNLAISRFTALGGDDLDRAIVQVSLLPAILAAAGGFDPQQRDVEERLVPRLQPTAERLKLAALDWLTKRGVVDLDGIRQNGDITFSDRGIAPFRIRDKTLQLPKPTLSLSQFADALEPFIGRFNPDLNRLHVFGPVRSALEKASINPDQLNAVLFIGGSSSNSVIRNAVMKYLPNSVNAIVPSDLRSHVSLGAAWHSFGFHAYGLELIRPITSEAILVVTRGGGLEIIVPASAEVPTAAPFSTRLRIDRERQILVELPICVGSESKLLGLLRIHAPDPKGFKSGEEIKITARITHEKLLEVEAEVAGVIAQTGFLNPLTNNEISPLDHAMLEAKQVFNESIIANSGRPDKHAVLNYAVAARQAGAFEIAADMYVAFERLEPDANYATEICYCYSKAGKSRIAGEWAKKSHNRKPDALTAYNLSCFSSAELRMSLLRESVKMNPDFALSHLALGRILVSTGDDSGQEHIQNAARIMEANLENQTISAEECRSLLQIARESGDDALAERAQSRIEFGRDKPLYEDENLADSTSGGNQVVRV